MTTQDLLWVVSCWPSPIRCELEYKYIIAVVEQCRIWPVIAASTLRGTYLVFSAGKTVLRLPKQTML